MARTSFPRALARQTSYPRGPTLEESKKNMAAVCIAHERLFCPLWEEICDEEKENYKSRPVVVVKLRHIENDLYCILFERLDV